MISGRLSPDVYKRQVPDTSASTAKAAVAKNARVKVPSLWKCNSWQTLYWNANPATGKFVDRFEEDMARYCGAKKPLRWYMITNSQPWDNLKFDIAGVDEVKRKFFGTLYTSIRLVWTWFIYLRTRGKYI